MDLVVGGRVIVVDSETSAVVRNQEVVADLKVLRDDGGLAGGDLGEERLTVPFIRHKARQPDLRHSKKTSLLIACVPVGSTYMS